nr:agmatine deiminase family protein [Campylobacterota bacterium]
DTIVYVSCEDPDDPHFETLAKMKAQLSTFTTTEGNLYQLIPLPLPSAKFKGEERLPATYANFLIANHVVLLPIYDDPLDKEIVALFKDLFSDREIIPINALRLIEEGGSIHCSTMQVAF